MVYIPHPGFTPNDPPQAWPLTPDLVTNRELTHWFIVQDPSPISLIPVEKTRQPGGGFKTDALPPRPEQIMKLIYQGGSADGIVATADGQSRRYDFILLGEWDATIHIGDFWEDPTRDGQFWVVNGLQPYNGYEVKAGVSSYGWNPDGG